MSSDDGLMKNPFDRTYTYVPTLTNLTISNYEVPRNYGRNIGPPFKPIEVRNIHDDLHESYRRKNKRLTDTEIKELVLNPNLPKSTRLKDLSQTANEKTTARFHKEKFYNMSFTQIANKISNTVSDVLNDLLKYKLSQGFDDFVQIFGSEDRLIYLGMIIVVFSLIVMLIRTTDTRSLPAEKNIIIRV